MTPRQNWTVGTSLTYQEIWHFQPDALLLTKRNDDYAALDVTVGHSISRNLSVRGELLFSRPARTSRCTGTGGMWRR